MHGVAADAVGPLRYATCYAVICVVGVWPLWCLLVLPDAPWASFVAMAMFGVLVGGGSSVAALTVRRHTYSIVGSPIDASTRTSALPARPPRAYLPCVY